MLLGAQIHANLGAYIIKAHIKLYKETPEYYIIRMPNNQQPQRKSWKLCRAHCQCTKCQYTLQCWKDKATIAGYNAGRTKYALDCFLAGNTQEHQFITEANAEVLPVPLDDDPVFPDTPEGEKAKKENNLYHCGICKENCVKVGQRKPIIYQCGHTNCAPCFNDWCMAEHSQGRDVACPYCRKTITKAIRLFTD